MLCFQNKQFGYFILLLSSDLNKLKGKGHNGLKKKKKKGTTLSVLGFIITWDFFFFLIGNRQNFIKKSVVCIKYEH
jgi:hypothetical protein